MHLIEDYRIRPAQVGKTLLVKAGDWDGSDLATPTAGDQPPLFLLRRQAERVALEGAMGSYLLEFNEIEEAEPDPLWESSAGICRHMDDDHSDTYKLFLRARGWRGSAEGSFSMPWVEQRGFFLSGVDCLAWIPFPQLCPTPNEVRKTLIKMLKEIRCD
ncbi:MAG: DUF2470 domain-containing protein [Candidatus Eremiobacteraeota bacterium]|nr:DUF2470 domain-containing protein [Candidatus Eremiobacteraeota bacterium]